MKFFIKNRDGNQVCVVDEGPDDAEKLAFAVHGLGGNKQEPHIRAMIETFLESGYKVISYDAVHTFGESKGGKFEDATVTNYYADLEDVINWASLQSWYTEPFVLCGHSLGGISIGLYAENYPNKIKALAPISTVVSGALSLRSPQNAKIIQQWKKDGIDESRSSKGHIKRLKWSHMEDRLRYDLLENVGELTMPVLMVVGSADESTPVEHQQLLYDKLPGKKEIHIIQGALHSFNEPVQQQELKALVKSWLQTI